MAAQVWEQLCETKCFQTKLLCYLIIKMDEELSTVVHRKAEENIDENVLYSLFFPEVELKSCNML